jgi:UDP-N-acetylglucosamine:LPS N-acetylglucosamine transferase
MKVLYLVFQALLGGHVLSASTIAKEMRTQGISPFFAGAEGAMTEVIKRDMLFEPVHIPIFHGTRQTYFTWKSFAAVRHLREIIRRHEINLIHAFDARSYLHAYIAGLQERVPVLCTLCGGIDPYYNLPAAPVLIVFSEEQKQKMVETFHWPASRVEVVRTRLDIRQIVDDRHRLGEEEANGLGLDPQLPKIMMISSFDGTKIRSIHKVLDVAEMLFSRCIRFQLVLIGGKGLLHDQAKIRAEEICGRYGAGLVVLTGPIVGAFRLLQRADIVLGVGRSAFEGMAYGKPTLIIGEKGYAGAMSPDTVDALAWYNFSGRNQQEEVDAELLVTVIRDLLHDPEQGQRLGTFAREFVFREIDVAHGAPRLREIYQRITRPEVQFPLWRQALSLAACLAPIAWDNSLHPVKEWGKRILHR